MSDTASISKDAIVEYWGSIVEMSRDIIEATCGIEVQQVDAECTNPEAGKTILAIISLVGDVEWSFFLSLPPNTAVDLVKQFAGFEIPFDSDDMADASGELANILAGRVKAALDEQGVEVEISVPSVLRADHMHVMIPKEALHRCARVATGLGPLWIGVIATS